MILSRLKALLDALTRRFEIVSEHLRAPRGSVHWSEYAVQNLSRAQFLKVPCTFPDLRDDRLLQGAIRYSLEKQLRSLQSQVEHGGFVLQLIAFCNDLLRRVCHARPYIPSAKILAMWLQRPMRVERFVEGLQAIEWTVEDRGLAGMSDLEGIPWHMPMDRFFEAWVETVFQSVARDTAAVLKVGRRRENTHPIDWEPAYLGSQKSLVPDLWLEWQDTTLIVDAKYKRHWEELQEHSWNATADLIREQHRNDLFQALSYANLAKTSRVITCLAYPCSPDTWTRMVEKKRVIHKAEISGGSRRTHLWLTAIPMATAGEKIKPPLLEHLRAAIAQSS